MKQYEADIFIESHGAPTGKKEFYEDINRWEQFALFVAQFGDNPGKIAQAMADFLKLDSLPEEFNQAMDYFMAGLRQQRKEGTSNSK
ncbi:hypothetical protein D3C73_1420470 [compost metagenome]